MNLSRVFRLRDHAHANAVFHTAHGILAFQFGDYFGDATFRNFVEPHERSVANQFSNVLGDFHGRFIPFTARQNVSRSFRKYGLRGLVGAKR